MNYENILSRAGHIIWRHKFLIILGALAALGSGLGSGSSNGVIGYSLGPDSSSTLLALPPTQLFQDPGRFSSSAFPIGLAAILIILALIVVGIIWAISSIARGALVAGVDMIEHNESNGFSIAFRAGLKRLWTLLGIDLLPAVPILILVVLSGSMGYIAYATKTRAWVPAMNNLALIGATVACVFIPIALLLNIARTFALRACMLEGLGVLNAYRRGIAVLKNHFGSAFGLFLIQLGVMIALILLMTVPGLILALCCLIWPILILFQGTAIAYFSTMWTLAWKDWTNNSV